MEPDANIARSLPLIHHLPPELMSAIFEYFVLRGLQDIEVMSWNKGPLLLLHIFHRWRTITQDTPSLFTHIVFRYDPGIDPYKLIPMFLRNSRTLPLVMKLNGMLPGNLFSRRGQRRRNKLFAQLRNELSRVTSLHVCNRPYLQYLIPMDTPCITLPILRYLDLAHPYHVSENPHTTELGIGHLIAPALIVIKSAYNYNLLKECIDIGPNELREYTCGSSLAYLHPLDLVTVLRRYGRLRTASFQYYETPEDITKMRLLHNDEWSSLLSDLTSLSIHIKWGICECLPKILMGLRIPNLKCLAVTGSAGPELFPSLTLWLSRSTSELQELRISPATLNNQLALLWICFEVFLRYRP